jgi:hypothetical protein
VKPPIIVEPPANANNAAETTQPADMVQKSAEPNAVQNVTTPPGVKPPIIVEPPVVKPPIVVEPPATAY